MFAVSVGGRRRLSCCLLGAILILVFGSTNNLTAKEPAFTATEQWILQQLVAGKDADLKRKFPHASSRVITPSFVRRLLTGNVPGLKLPAYGVHIWSATVKGDLDLTNEEIPYDVRMNDCDFEGDFTLPAAKFKGTLSLAGSRFHRPVDFRYVRIDEGFDAKNTHFGEEDFEVLGAGDEYANKAEFGNIKVEGPLLLDGAIFDRPVRFYAARITGNFEAKGVYFNQSADFELMTVGGHAFFTGAVFERNARFFRIKVSENFEAEGAHFNDKTVEINLEGLSAYSALLIKDETRGATVFNGPVRFYGLNITSNLELNDAVINGAANFENMSIKGHVFLLRTRFNGEASFWSTTVAQSFAIEDAQFNGALSWVHFDDLKADVLGFRGTSISNRISVSGLAFREVRPEGLQNFYNLIGRASYDAGAYAALEDYYRRHGNISEANNVYITRRRRERAHLSYGAWFGDLLFYGFVGYGRRPWQVIIPICIVLACGWLIFRNRQLMQAQDAKDESRHYSPFMYSLDLFLPIVDLRAAKIWEPKESRRLARMYLTFHVIAGWVLITIFVAAITGITK